MINRPNYIEAINPFIDQPLVKILAGIRRCGKSTIFEMLVEELLRRGVPADHIICKRYTEMDIPENITAKQMYDELVEGGAWDRLRRDFRWKGGRRTRKGRGPAWMCAREPKRSNT